MANINRKYLLDKRPTGMPEDECWKLVEEETVPLKSGEILIQVKFLSIDPYMRGRMNDGVSYAAPAKIGTKVALKKGNLMMTIHLNNLVPKPIFNRTSSAVLSLSFEVTPR